MSRQFRFFLLPSDAEALIADLRDRIGAQLIDAKSSRPEPVRIDSPMRQDPAREDRRASVSTYCYLAAATGAEMKMKYFPKQGSWLVDDERSEVIEFSGLEYDGEILLQGRFYFKPNFLLDNAIWPKRDEFLQWAGRIFRRSKRILQYDKGLDSYVGEHANAWRAKGGRFAWM
jgi:hypothetical protein